MILSETADQKFLFRWTTARIMHILGSITQQYFRVQVTTLLTLQAITQRLTAVQAAIRFTRKVQTIPFQAETTTIFCTLTTNIIYLTEVRATIHFQPMPQTIR